VDGATAILAMGSNQSDSVGTVTVANGGSITGTGTSTLTSSGTFEMQSGSVSAILGGSGISLNKTTSGTVTLSGANTYTGTTTVSAGSLLVTGSAATAPGCVVTVESGATLGGTGTVLGPAVGITVLFGLREAIALVGEQLAVGTAGVYALQQVVYGLILMLVVLLLPEGLVRVAGSWVRRWRPARATRAAAAPRTVQPGAASGPRAADTGSETAPLLQVAGLTRAFEGLVALRDVSFELYRGEILGIIGPNGAGKTTMMDVITGKTRPDTGIVQFNGGVDLTQLDEAAIANLGIGRKFQKPTVFENRTVFDNLELALAGARRPHQSLFFRLSGEQMDRIDSVLSTISLTAQRNTQAGSLSHGQKQWLEIGMLLMQDPELLLVDEPVAGMTDAETETTAHLLKTIAQTRSVVVVEHDMVFVRALDCRVNVLHEGSVLAEGSLEVVQNNEQVIEVYLGR